MKYFIKNDIFSSLYLKLCIYIIFFWIKYYFWSCSIMLRVHQVFFKKKENSFMPILMGKFSVMGIGIPRTASTRVNDSVLWVRSERIFAKPGSPSPPPPISTCSWICHWYCRSGNIHEVLIFARRTHNFFIIIALLKKSIFTVYYILWYVTYIYLFKMLHEYTALTIIIGHRE